MTPLIYAYDTLQAHEFAVVVKQKNESRPKAGKGKADEPPQTPPAPLAAPAAELRRRPTRVTAAYFV